ncbi:hypothetical protein MTR_8g077517 [Medicago truncatula]|uniref:Uncharacterized protein n=1 Tax=Medicago truncatula TaxID=3880 RepID=A0A072U3P3_MEDTR|nr:hypothetical protein MTR_8g077517 [Medicago truncatula]
MKKKTPLFERDSNSTKNEARRLSRVLKIDQLEQSEEWCRGGKEGSQKLLGRDMEREREG